MTVRFAALSLALSLLVLSVSCGQDERPSETPTTRPADAAVSGHTGAVTEAEFEAMHELAPSKRPTLRGAMIELGEGTAYLALPEGDPAPRPGIIVIHEWWGLNDHVKLWTDRLARDGYAALAVDLYGGETAETSERAMELMKAVDDAAARATLAAAHAYLVRDERILAPKTGVIGWCFGGAWALQTALATPELDAAVMYYGRLVQDAETLKAIRAPLLGIFADRDRSITKAAVDDFEKALTKAEVSHVILRYDADHAFANPSSARYDAAAATAAWKHVRAFFARHLKGEILADEAEPDTRPATRPTTRPVDDASAPEGR